MVLSVTMPGAEYHFGAGLSFKRKRFGTTAVRVIIVAMPVQSGASKAVGMVPEELKSEPRSKGIATPRKKKPKELAVITECCTGCAGSPACVEYCPGEHCMFCVPVEDTPPIGRMTRIGSRSHPPNGRSTSTVNTDHTTTNRP